MLPSAMADAGGFIAAELKKLLVAELGRLLAQSRRLANRQTGLSPEKER